MSTVDMIDRAQTGRLSNARIDREDARRVTPVARTTNYFVRELRVLIVVEVEDRGESAWTLMWATGQSVIS